MKDLGYLNGWTLKEKDGEYYYDPEEHPEYCKCKELGHVKRQISHSSRGTDNEYVCDICQICYHVDSSD